MSVLDLRLVLTIPVSARRILKASTRHSTDDYRKSERKDIREMAFARGNLCSEQRFQIVPE